MDTIRTTMMPVPLSLNRLLEHAGRLFPEREIVSRMPDRSLRRHSYGQWYARTRAFAAALQKLGLRRGDRVATLCWNHHAHLEAYFGIPAAGGVMHTLNLRLAPEDLGWIAHHAKDRFLLVDDTLLPLYERFASLHRFERVIVFPFSGAPVAQREGDEEKGVAPIDDYERLLAPGAVRDGTGGASSDAGATFQYVAHDENDPVAMCYTSGTTGRPKGVVYSHRSTVLHSLNCALPDYVALSANDVVLPVTPMFHANSWGIPYAAVMLGAKLVFPGPHLHPEDLLDLMQLEPPTLALGVPTIWLGMIQAFEAHPGRWKLPAGMRSMVGGAAVPESLIRAFARNGVRLAQGWGMTETSPMASLFFEKPELRERTSEDEWFARKATCGMPVPLVEVRIMGDQGPAPWNGRDVGELQVRGPFITGSYHEEPRSPDKFSDDGWLRTGDVASIDPHGHIRITDRTKDLIKSGGEWISSVDLENAIMAHSSVAEAAVIAIAHPKWTERPLACVVLKSGKRLDAVELREFLAPRCARWQLPDAIEFVDEIPRTSTGKFWKVKLRERYADWRWPEDAMTPSEP